MLSQGVINLIYVIAAALFIFGLKGMAHPKTAVRGNLMSAIGMLIAVVVTLFSGGLEFNYILIGVAIGAAIGVTFAVRIAMTAMPEMVAIFNGFGGAASVVVAAAEIVKAVNPDVAVQPDFQMAIATSLAGLIGGVTFFGSYIAFGKLAEFLGVKWKLYPWQSAVKWGFALIMVAFGAYVAYEFAWHWLGIVGIVFYIATAAIMFSKKAVFPGMQTLKVLAALAALALGVIIVLQLVGVVTVFDAPVLLLYWTLIAVSALLGVTLTFSIGGADMPVVIALLNSYSGIAAAMTGFVISNTVLIIAGSLVGASGIILTNLMCKAMNRSLTNVLFGAMGSEVFDEDVDEIYKNVKSTAAEEIAMMLETAERVLIVPGYGMAVSQAQHAVRDLANLVEEKFGAEVFFGVHPVAGRMPGHMNVLLAEANVPYDKLWDEVQSNAEISQIDVAIVIGANDVVNPVARTDPKSPIAGMPIIDVDKAKQVVVIKRSLSPGFAGIANPLFAEENAVMFFSDGKKAFQDIIEAVKEG